MYAAANAEAAKLPWVKKLAELKPANGEQPPAKVEEAEKKSASPTLKSTDTATTSTDSSPEDETEQQRTERIFKRFDTVIDDHWETQSKETD